MTTITQGNYGASIHDRNDGDGVDVYFLYNMSTERNGDVHSRKTYKSRKTAERKIAEYIKAQTA